MAMKDALRRMERRQPDARTTLDTCALGGRATVPAHQRRQPPGSLPNDADYQVGRPPHPAIWASLPDTGAWTVARNCPIARVRYTLYTNGAPLFAVRFLLMHYRKPSRQPGYRRLHRSTSPSSLFVNMSRVYSVNAVNRLTGLFRHG